MGENRRRPSAAVKSPDVTVAHEGLLRSDTPAARWVITAAVLGSGIAFLDSTVVNIALPAIERDLGGGLAALQWTVDAYLLTLGSLIIFGGSLGDMYGRRKIFVAGLAAFTVASVLCGLAPNTAMLIGARALQGVGGALLVPASLSIISASFHPDDRGQAIGAWSGLSGVSTALGPFLGGYLVDSASWGWRLVFLINLPIAAVTIWITLRHVPETRDASAPARPDFAGAVTGALALGGIVYALIEGPARGFTATSVLAAGLIGVAALVAFPFVERRLEEPMLPLGIFGSRQFSGANGATFAVYAALGGGMFLFIIELQVALGYSAIEAGAAFFPTTLMMLLLSPRVGRVAGRIGPRWPMTFGPLIAAFGLALLSWVRPGVSYLTGVLPAVVIFGFGLALTVTPLTSAVLATVDQRHAGIASGVNNAVARIAGLLAVAVLPFAAGLARGEELTGGFQRAMLISAALCALGGVVSWATIRQSVRLRTVMHPHISQTCHHGDERRAA
jgi:EmrB/QacA subfamily drug resistance transporter